MTWIKAILLLGIASLIGVLPSSGADNLVIISSHWEGYRFEIETRFKSWYETKYNTQVNLDWRDAGGGSESLKFVLSEFKQEPSGIGIDLFFGGGNEPQLLLKKEKLLQSYRPPLDIMDQIPPDISGMPIYDPEFYWFGNALSGFGILSNKRVIDIKKLPPVNSWEDLAAPELFTWVGSGDPRGSGSAQKLYEIILQSYGWEKGWSIITRMAGNVRVFHKNSSTAVKDTSLGDVAYCLAIDVYGLYQVSSVGTDSMAFLYPKGATVINPDAIGIFKGAPNIQTAQRFIDFLLSTEGQSLWVQPRGKPGGPTKFEIPRMSVRPDLYGAYPPGTGFLNPFTQPVRMHFDDGLASRRRHVLQGLLGATLIDPHSDLTKAWNKIRILPPGQRDTAIEQFAAAPISENELNSLAADWDNAVKRNKLILHWQREAMQKYRRFL